MWQSKLDNDHVSSASFKVHHVAHVIRKRLSVSYWPRFMRVCLLSGVWLFGFSIAGDRWWVRWSQADSSVWLSEIGGWQMGEENMQYIGLWKPHIDMIIVTDTCQPSQVIVQPFKYLFFSWSVFSANLVLKRQLNFSVCFVYFWAVQPCYFYSWVQPDQLIYWKCLI